MSGNRSLAAAKLVSILGFLVLLGSTYFLRSEVLTLNSIRFSADEARAEYELQQRKKNYPYEVQRHEVAQKNYEAARRRDRQRYEEATKNYERDLARLKERYQVAQKNYEVQEKHYRKMLELYLSDYEGYVKAIKDKYRPPALPAVPTPPKVPPEPTPPQLPVRPQPPRSPEYTQRLSEIDAAFRAQKHHYFQVTGSLNWVALGGAICLVGGLLYLILFDTANGRLIYLATLLLSFVFMIGPSFHSIISAIVGFLEAPGVY